MYKQVQLQDPICGKYCASTTQTGLTAVRARTLPRPPMSVMGSWVWEFEFWAWGSRRGMSEARLPTVQPFGIDLGHDHSSSHCRDHGEELHVRLWHLALFDSDSVQELYT